ncbi:MAG TPA: PEP-CTERM system histidine kinase PrsK, partial [Allosphingosinicella sp.]
MIGLIALWSHLLAACLFTGLVLWQLRHWRGDQQTRPLITAFAVMAVWSIFMALLGPHHFLSLMADSARDLAFLAFMYGLMNGEEGDYRQGPVKLVYGTVAAVVALQIVLAGLMPRFHNVPHLVEALVSTREMIGLTIAAGALVLVHNLYGQATPQSRGVIRPSMVALALMWVYDLHLYTVSYLTRDSAEGLLAVRGVVVALLVPIFAMG